MTSSNTFNKFISIGAAALLALSGSLIAAEPASATPLTNIKSMDYQMEWLPGGTIESTFAASSLGFNSGFKMDDVTALRGQTLTLGSVNSGLPNGVSLTDYGYITFYASIADRNAQYPTIGQGAQIYNSGPSSQTQLVVPSTAVAMRISYTTRFNGGGGQTLAAGTYGSTPHVFSNSVEIPISTSSSGSSIYTDYSYGSVEGATSAFTTPATGTVRSASFKVAGCIDMAAVTSSTTYTAVLKVNGTAVSGMTDYIVSSLGGYSFTEVMGSSNSFGSGQLSTWRQAGQALKITVSTNSNSAYRGAATQYDSTLELVDQASNSLLKDCTPSTPAGSGTIAASVTPGALSFTPDSNLGALSSWTINVYKSSDNSMVSSAPGMGTTPANIMPPFGQGGPGSWTIGESYYAKAVNSVTINGQSISSGLGTASPAFTIPANFSSGGGGGVVAPQNCNPAIVLTNISYSSTTLDPTSVVRRIFNNDSSIGTSTACLATFSSANVGTLSTLNGAVIGTPSRYTGLRASVSNLPVSWTGLTTGSGILSGRTLNDGDVYTVSYYVGIAQAPTLSDTATFSLSIVLNPTGTSGNNSNGNSVSVAPSEPLPLAVQPLVPALLALKKPMASNGGKLSLAEGNFTGLISATVAGKSLDYILGKTGLITLTVPQGEAGKNADLHLTFTSGTVTIQDAIKYVAPVNVTKIGVRPIAIAAGAKKISDGVADQIRQAAFANLKNDTIQCIGYAAANSVAAKAAAKLTAVQACGFAVKANSDLKVADVVVIVDKLKARTQGVGIKVYKADN